MILLALRGAVMFYGFDRLPYLSISDEAAQNDPAVFMSRGEGLFGKSYAGILGHEPYRSHQMPVYTLTQAAVFRLFGFSPFTLRGPAILSWLAACAVTLGLLFGLTRDMPSGGLSVLIASLMLGLEPTALVVVRQGRNDSLVALWGVLACWFAFPPARQTSNSFGRLILAALFAGLAIATHPVGILYCVVVAACLGLLPWNGSAAKTLLIAATAVAVPCLLWLATFRGDSVSALRQMVTWARMQAPMPNLTGDAYLALWQRDLSGFVRLGGLLFTIFAVPTLAVYATAGAAWRKKSAPALRMPAALTIACLGVLVGLFVFFGTRPTRFIAIFPIGILAFGVLLSAAANPLRYFVIGAAVVILAVEGTATAAVLLRMRAEFAMRDPERFAALVESIPASARVAADSQLWYAFLKAHRDFRIVDPDLDLDAAYWNAGPEVFQNYQVIILDEDSLPGYKFIPPWNVRKFRAGSNSFVVITR